MENENSTTQEETQQKRVSSAYKRPLIIYDGIISTRAGSPLGSAPTGGNNAAGIDAADLFD